MVSPYLRIYQLRFTIVIQHAEDFSKLSESSTQILILLTSCDDQTGQASLERRGSYVIGVH